MCPQKVEIIQQFLSEAEDLSSLFNVVLDNFESVDVFLVFPEQSCSLDDYRKRLEENSNKKRGDQKCGEFEIHSTWKFGRT